jgi:hypothetical protein
VAHTWEGNRERASDLDSRRQPALGLRLPVVGRRLGLQAAGLSIPVGPRNSLALVPVEERVVASVGSSRS